MPALITRRDHVNDVNNDNPNSANSPFPLNLLISFLLFIVLALVLVCLLYVIRRYQLRQKEAAALPSYDTATRNRHRSCLTINTSRDAYSEKQCLIGNTSPTSLSPDSVPEIRITFPEEEDEDGRRVSGRVVVVKVGEAGVGFVRPLDHDELPPYQRQHPTDRFDSVDMERIGGLKEKK
jgi:hypothetical protein